MTDLEYEWKIHPELGPLPWVGGRSLCSSRDPIREARQWCARYQGTLLDESAVAIIGLGAGFHIGELASQYKDLKIYVFEISDEIIEIFQEGFRASPNVVPVRVIPQRGVASYFCFSEISSTSFQVLRFTPALHYWADVANQLERELLGYSRDTLTESLRAQGLFASAEAIQANDFATSGSMCKAELIRTMVKLPLSEDELVYWGILRELIK